MRGRKECITGGTSLQGMVAYIHINMCTACVYTHLCIYIHVYMHSLFFPPLSYRVKMAKGDPKKPKGKMSAYAFFVQTCREEHKKKNPEVPVNFAEFSKKCSERWKVP